MKRRGAAPCKDGVYQPYSRFKGAYQLLLFHVAGHLVEKMLEVAFVAAPLTWVKAEARQGSSLVVLRRISRCQERDFETQLQS
jgi:hypothetical protein